MTVVSSPSSVLPHPFPPPTACDWTTRMVLVLQLPQLRQAAAAEQRHALYVQWQKERSCMPLSPSPPHCTYQRSHISLSYISSFFLYSFSLLLYLLLLSFSSPSLPSCSLVLSLFLFSFLLLLLFLISPLSRSVSLLPLSPPSPFSCCLCLSYSPSSQRRVARGHA